MRRFGNGRSWLWAIWGLSTALVGTAVLVVFARDHTDQLSRANEMAGVGAFAVAVAALFISIAQWRMSVDAPPSDPTTQLDQACGLLVRDVSEQWRREASARGLLIPKPIRVRWTSTLREVSATPDQILDSAVPGKATRLRLHGDVREVVAKWRELPARQLVIIGAPGAGKTSLAVLLVHGLLADRKNTEPVPVLLTLSEWNPSRHDLVSWLADRIAVQYPTLTDSVRFGLHAPTRLINAGRVLPVLDGLDEMSKTLRPLAVKALTQAIAHDRPLVLTCRATEFEDAIAATGTPLARAAVVELERISGAQAAEYLPAEQINGERRWQPVVEELRTHPDGPLALALSTPLMVYLARTVYAAPTTEPRKLTELMEREIVETHLLQNYLPAVYAHETTGSGYDCTPEQARRWMMFLAQHLRNNIVGETNLAWWDLRRAVSPWLIGSIIALVPGIAIGAAAAAGARLGIGLGVGVIVGLAGAVAARRWVPRRPNTVLGIAGGAAGAVAGAFLGGLLARANGLGGGPTKGLVGAVGVGLAVGPVGGWIGGAFAGLIGGVGVGLTASSGTGVWAAVVDGLAGALGTALVVSYAGRDSPAERLPGWRGVSWSPLAIGSGLMAGIGLGVTAGPLAGLAGGLAGLALGLFGKEPKEARDVQASTGNGPRAVLRRDRNTFLLLGFVAGGTVCAGASLAVLPVVGIAGGITVGIVFGCLQAAWARYMVARCWLALRGDLPWRLMSFLEDAHERRGVLRQVGAVYEFRHAEVRRTLAGNAPTGPQQ